MQKRFDVIGCNISRTTFAGAIRAVTDLAVSGEGGYVCFTNVHAAVMARQDSDFWTVLENSFMTMPDGKPLSWVAKVKGIKGVEQVSGPDFLPALMASDSVPHLRHYFYGGKQEMLEQLITGLRNRFPKTKVVGWESPPFRELSPEEDEMVMQRIRQSSANVVWIGLGAPKQELWMAAHAERLKPAVLMGIGAAFDFHAGYVERAPGWIRSIGLEWLHRLSQEPERLWKRYLVTNTLFVFYLFKGLFRRLPLWFFKGHQ